MQKGITAKLIYQLGSNNTRLRVFLLLNDRGVLIDRTQ